jgi:hypothetical protein
MKTYNGDYYYYLNGKFFDRMSTKPSIVAKSLKARIVKRKAKVGVYGESGIWLSSKKLMVKPKR